MTQPHKPRPKADPVDPTDHAQDPGTQRGPDRDSARPTANPDPVQSIDARGEVRAGPGDADARRLPKGEAGKRRGRGVFLALLIAGPALMLLFWLLAA